MSGSVINDKLSSVSLSESVLWLAVFSIHDSDWLKVFCTSFIHVTHGVCWLNAREQRCGEDAVTMNEEQVLMQEWFCLLISEQNNKTNQLKSTTFGTAMPEHRRPSFCISGSLFIAVISLAIANSSVNQRSSSHHIGHNNISSPRQRPQTNTTRIQIDLKG